MKFKAKFRIERTVEIDGLEGTHAAEAKATITDEQIGLKNYERIISCQVIPVREPEEPKDAKT